MRFYVATVLSVASGVTYALDTLSPSLFFYPTSSCGIQRNMYFCCTNMEPNGCCTNNIVGNSYCSSLGGQNLSPQHTVNFFASQNCARRQFGGCSPLGLDSEECCSEDWTSEQYRPGLRNESEDGILRECSMRLEAEGDRWPASSSDSEREESSSSDGTSSGSDEGLFMISPQRQRQGGGSARAGTGSARNGNGNGSRAGAGSQRNVPRAPPAANRDLWSDGEGPSRNNRARPATNRAGNGAGPSRNGGRPAANNNGNGAGPSRNGNNNNGAANSNAPRPGTIPNPNTNTNSTLAVQAPPSGPPSPSDSDIEPICRSPDTVSYLDASGERRDLKFEPEKAMAVLRAIDRGLWRELEDLSV